MTMILCSNYIFDTQTKQTFAGYLKITEGKIVDVGPLDALPQNEVVMDYSNKMIVPGFIDSHVHFYLSALIHAGVLTHLTGNTEQDFANAVPQLPIKHGWKLGIGWFGSDFGQQVYPTKDSLDAVCADVPVMLISGDAHSIWLNSKAMAELEITRSNLPKGISGEALMMEGELTGCFLEAVAINYLADVLSKIPESAESYLTYMKHLNRMGVTTIGDVALTGESWDDLVYPEYFQQVEEQATIRAVFYPAMREDFTKLTETYNKYQSPKVQMGGVKQFFDGVTSTHTAFLKEAYETPYFAGDVGSPLIPTEKMRQLILLANQQDWPIRIHTIGDQAIHQALRYYQESLACYPLSAGKFNTLEHLEVMDARDLPLVQQEQVVISVQPSHLLVGYETLDEEVGSKRASEMFPFQSFLQNGATLAFGTDSPVVIDVTPLDSIYYAVARREKSGIPYERLMPQERISIEEALIAHTAGAAQALSRQDIGSLQVGNRADICILSQNILDCTEEELLATKIVGTIFDGEWVYREE